MSKSALRKELKEIRKELSLQRRFDAAQSLTTSLLPVLAPCSFVLSFYSLPQEINTSSLNRLLASSGKLLLPKVMGDTLKIFHVTNLDMQLEEGAFGILEPNPILCEEVARDLIEIALVPALGFDKANHRIGYGKGFYDRFLADIECPTIGIGYQEQLVDSIPVEATDLSLTGVNLF